MNDPGTLLLALQLGDSAFPAGGFAFSWGLEGLAADGLVDGAADVAEIIAQQLSQRWHSMDRVLLGGAYAAASLDTVAELDRLAEAATVSAPLRAGSRRAGRALLGVSLHLGLPDVTAYRAAVAEDARLGHLAVMQGMVFRSAGLTLALTELVSGWTVISGLSSAAVRLGLIGHKDALRMGATLRARLAGLLRKPAATIEHMSSFTPLIDIALMRNIQRDMRMFAT